MRLYSLLLLLFLGVGLTAPLAAEEGDRRGPKWIPRGEVYGLIRLVPEPEVKHLATLHDWRGIDWDRYRAFFIWVTFDKGRQEKPRQFEFVNPSIGIRGERAGGSAGVSSGVQLFDGPSTIQDIDINYIEPPEEIELEREYLAAEVSGKGAITRWKVYIRFTSEQPQRAGGVEEK